MTKAYSRFISAFFAVFLAGFLIFHLVLPDKTHSETENRTLAQFPAFSWEALKDGSFTKDLEEYFADQFPLRDGWTGLKARAEQLLGKSEFNDVYLCGDTLISKVPVPDATLLSNNLSYMQRLAGKTDANVYFGLIPSAAEVWKDKLPYGADSWDQTGLLASAGELTGLPTVDFHSALSAHKEEEIFYRTDHHWTTLGAFYGANTVLDTLGKDALKESDFTPEIASESFNGTLYSTSGIHWLPSDTMEFWVSEDGLSVRSWKSGKEEAASLYDRSYLGVKDKYSAFLGGNQPLCVIENKAVTDGSKLLLVRDSYADSLAPFLAQRYSEIHLIDLRQNRMPVSAYAAQNGIDDILVVYSVQNFISERNLVVLQ